MPHVPAPATKWVIRPAVWRHSSGPVVCSWASGLAGLAYWLGRNASQLVGQPLGDRVVALRVLGRDGDRADDDLGAVGLAAARSSPGATLSVITNTQR